MRFSVLSLVMLSVHCASSTPPPEDADCTFDYVPVEADFTCSQDWTQVGNMRITNRCGLKDEAVRVATDSRPGERYPVGTLITLMTGEAMAKRGARWDQGNQSWEYFKLSVSPRGASIDARGAAEVKNDVGSCLDCHAGARDFDFVCRTDHGCEDLPVSGAQLAITQTLDPRCGP